MHNKAKFNQTNVPGRYSQSHAQHMHNHMSIWYIHVKLGTSSNLNVYKLPNCLQFELARLL